MKIGIPKESLTGETRVAAVPDTVAAMLKLGLDVIVESGAGLNAYIDNTAYQNAGAKIIDSTELLYEEADVILKVQPPLFNEKINQHESAFLKEGSLLIGQLRPFSYPELTQQLNEKKITAFSLDLLPRLARTQTMDSLSSMSNIAGYKSVIMAAHYLGKFFPLLTTAAGHILPAKVVIIGAGVAGLQAIATARRLGAVVTALDTRPITAEQVKSLGADFVSLQVSHEAAQDLKGYAKEQSSNFYVQEQKIIRSYSKDADVLITTALIPGQRAPLLITEEMVKEMKPGSVIVDLALEQGGNCALSEAGKIVNKHQVTLIGLLNMPSSLPIHASQLYSNNIWSFLKYLTQEGKGLHLDLSDEIIQSSLITHLGSTQHPLLQLKTPTGT